MGHLLAFLATDATPTSESIHSLIVRISVGSIHEVMEHLIILTRQDILHIFKLELILVLLQQHAQLLV